MLGQFVTLACLLTALVEPAASQEQAKASLTSESSAHSSVVAPSSKPPTTTSHRVSSCPASPTTKSTRSFLYLDDIVTDSSVSTKTSTTSILPTKIYTTTETLYTALKTTIVPPTLTSYVVRNATAKTTVTVPTACTFTPISSDALFTGSVTEVFYNYTEYATYAATRTVRATLTYNTQTTITVSRTKPTTTYYSGTTTTSTSSVGPSGPVETVYAACGADNIINQYGGYGIANIIYDVNGYPPFNPYIIDETNTYAYSAVDCCNQCQRRDTRCLASLWYPPEGPQPVPLPCRLFTLSDEAAAKPGSCAGGTAVGFWIAAGGGYMSSVSNGPCGQVIPAVIEN